MESRKGLSLRCNPLQNFLCFLSLPEVHSKGSRSKVHHPASPSAEFGFVKSISLPFRVYRLQAAGLWITSPPSPPLAPLSRQPLSPTFAPLSPQLHRPLLQSGTICTSGSSSGKSLKLIYNCSRMDAQMERGGVGGEGKVG